MTDYRLVRASSQSRWRRYSSETPDPIRHSGRLAALGFAFIVITSDKTPGNLDSQRGLERFCRAFSALTLFSGIFGGRPRGRGWTPHPRRCSMISAK